MNEKKQQTPAGKAVTQQMKIVKRRKLMIFIVSVVLAVGFFILGLLVSPFGPPDPRWMYMLLFVLAVVMPVFVAVTGKLTAIATVNKLTATPVKEMQQRIISQRENAMEEAEKSRNKLAQIKQDSAITAVMMIVAGILIPYLAAKLVESDILKGVFLLYSMIPIAAGISRIRFKMPREFAAKDESVVSREEYPALYALVEDAAKESGWQNEVHIAVMPDGNVGISELDGSVTLLLGAIMLSVLSEEELRSVLMHEFSHVRSNRGNKTLDYLKWLYIGRFSDGVLGFLNSAIFDRFDIPAVFEGEMYRFGLSVIEESRADFAMTESNSKETACSALLKTYFYSRHSYEDGTYDKACDYESETPMDDMVSRECRLFKERMAERMGLWLELIPKEILARNASHPTMKMRLDAMGVEEYVCLPQTGSDEYLAECDKAVKFADERIQKSITKEEYDKNRKEFYLDNLELVNKWKAEGEPLTAVNYRDIVQALRALGRNSEAEALCERAIAELPDAASVFARFIKGSALAHRYDKAAIPILYGVIDSNYNYLDEALDFIGTLCCLTGDEEELSIYREKALELGQREKDEFSKMDAIRPGDDLSPETELPKAEKDALIAYIRERDTSHAVREVYMVRKTVSERLFTTAVIVRFKGDIDNDFMHDLFLYLDTVSDWQYSLFEYREVPAEKIKAVAGSLMISSDE